MSQPVIQVERLGKEYVIGAREAMRDSFREMLTSGLLAPFRRFRRLSGRVSEEERVWALRDVSFQVPQGEIVGIIGRNGAGKSTLLKILSRITAPTQGRAAIRGRVASLLEVGTGFHPELTGRENIFLNGAILGMSRQEVRKKFDEIVEFAGVTKFIDTPVKRFSSGMYLRLAFAVAAHLEPEILIVDEVLAVGDAEFQRKCLGKLGEVARGGRTVLFVSHNLSAVRTLCTRCLVVDGGRIVMDTVPSEAIETYLSSVEQQFDVKREWTWSEANAPGNGKFRLRRVLIEGDKSKGLTLRRDENISILVEYDQNDRITAMALLLRFLTVSDEVAFATFDTCARTEESYPAGRYKSICVIPANLLNQRDYIISIAASETRGFQTKSLLETTDVGRIVIEQDSPRRWPGVVRPRLKWQVTKIQS